MKDTRLRSRGSTTSPTEATTELRLELARSGTLGLLALVTSSVTVAVTATVATTSTTASTAPLTVLTTTEHASGRSRALLLDVRLGHNLGREVEPLTEVVETLRGEGVVVVLP
jgi:hypothetical protein